MSVFKEHPTASAHINSIEVLKRALASGASDDWIQASRVWRRDLEDLELAQLTLAGLLALDDEMGSIVLSSAFEDLEMPFPPFWSAMGEASSWADRADYPSVKAFTLAGFNRMTPEDQSAFLNYVSPRAAA